MNLLLSIGIILSQLPVPVIDRDEVGREQRLDSIAISINRAAQWATCSADAAREQCKPIASDPALVAAELLVIANEESGMRSNVHRDECSAWQCDPVKYRILGVVRVIHQARSLWQLHRPRIWTDARWKSISGVSQRATDAAAWTAATWLAGGHGICGTAEGAITYFSLGGMCHSYAFAKQARRRAALVTQTRARLLRLIGTKQEQIDAKGVAAR